MTQLDIEKAQALKQSAVDYLRYEELIVKDHNTSFAIFPGTLETPVIDNETYLIINEHRSAMFGGVPKIDSSIKVDEFVEKIRKSDSRNAFILLGAIGALMQVWPNFDKYDDTNTLNRVMQDVRTKLDDKETPTNPGLLTAHGFLAILEHYLSK